MLDTATIEETTPSYLNDQEDDRRKFARLPLPDAIPPGPTEGAAPPIPPPMAGMPPSQAVVAQPPANVPEPPPMMPPSMPAIKEATAPFVAGRTPPAQVDPSTMPPAPTAAPAAASPAQPPQLHGWRKALDVAGSMLPIGQDIERAIPGTPQNWNAKQAQQTVQATREQAQALGAQNVTKGQQEIEKTAQESKMVPVPGHPELGEVEARNLPALLKQIETNEGKTDTADINQAGANKRNQDRIDAKAALPVAMKMGVLKPDIVAQVGPMPEDPKDQAEWGRKYDELAAKGGQKQTGLGTYAMVRLLDYFQKYNPAGLQMMPEILKQAGIAMPSGAAIPVVPPGQPTDENGRPLGNAQPGAPTTTTRTMGQMAEKVLPRIPEIRKEIAEVAPLLGPAEGRMNVEFLLGKVGSTGNPDSDRKLAGLRTDLAMLGSGAARFHINSVQAMEEMLRQVPLGKASPGALNGALDKIEEWAKGARNEGRGRPATQNAPTSPANALPPGWK